MSSYLRPARLSEALAALADHPLTILAGGTAHYAARGRAAPDENILDITALPDLHTVTLHDGNWRVPCLVTWTALIGAKLPPLLDGLRHAARGIGGPQVRNAGTVVGNLCLADAASDGAPCLLALDASVELTSVLGTRILPVAGFVRGHRHTARRSDELATALLIPDATNAVRTVFRKLAPRQFLAPAIATVAAVAEFAADGRIVSARIAVGACGPAAARLPALEAALAGCRPEPALVRAEHIAALAPPDNLRASGAYRRLAVLELLRRALGELAAPLEAAA